MKEGVFCHLLEVLELKETINNSKSILQRNMGLHLRAAIWNPFLQIY